MTTRLETPEFALIRRYFSQLTNTRPDVLLGIGDDAALTRPPGNCQLATSVDTLVSGVHFLETVSPESLGHKALAVNLSDLAAMGAEPAWVTLALTLPRIDDQWLEDFARGFSRLAQAHAVQLIGGDTTRGPLSMTVQVQGFLPDGVALRRDTARVGDDIYVTGTLGDAALGLYYLQHGLTDAPETADLVKRLERPQPRVAAGLAIRDLAHSAIDLSDGLAADLGHILDASGVGARVALAHLPCCVAVSDAMRSRGDWSLAVSGGDDYELCLTAPVDARPALAALSRSLDLPITRIGQVEAEPGLRWYDDAGQPWHPEHGGYDHFTEHDD
ncbi:MAG: thiamine-phosphate kinase [Candidatus Thiodiazotropha sp.]